MYAILAGQFAQPPHQFVLANAFSQRQGTLHPNCRRQGLGHEIVQAVGFHSREHGGCIRIRRADVPADKIIARSKFVTHATSVHRLKAAYKSSQSFLRPEDTKGSLTTSAGCCFPFMSMYTSLPIFCAPRCK